MGTHLGNQLPKGRLWGEYMKYGTKSLSLAKFQMAFPTREARNPHFSNPLNSRSMDGLLECELSVKPL